MPTQYIEDPQTKQQIAFEWDKETPPNENMINSLLLAARGNSMPTPQPQPKTFVDNVLNDWAARKKKVDESGLQTQGAQSLYAAGQLAGGVLDVPMQFLSTAADLAIPKTKEGFKQLIGSIGATAKPVIDALPSLPKGVGQGAETALNIAGLVPTGWAANKLANRGANAAIEPVLAAQKVDQMMDKSIVNGYTKGIKPTVVGKSDAGLVRKANDNAKTAIKDIVNSVDTPLSQSPNILEDFSTAVSTTKKKIWADATKISAEAGEQGAKVNILPVLNDMKAVKTDVLLQAADPTLANTLTPYIDAWENLIKTKGQYVSPAEAEDMIAALNNKAKPFWKDPSSHTQAATVERIAQNLRKQTFDAMEGMQGLAYQDLRKRYGAQLAIEKEVTNRATIDGRKAPYGFFDIANIPAAGEFVSSLASGNAFGVLKAGTMLTAKNVMKANNDPSKIIRKMFKDVETLNAIKNRKIFPDAKPMDKLAGDISGSRPTPLALPMPERGFTLQGQPYGEVLHPSRVGQNLYDAKPPLMLEGRRSIEPQGRLPQFTGGQDFTMPQGTPYLPQVSNAVRLPEGQVPAQGLMERGRIDTPNILQTAQRPQLTGLMEEPRIKLSGTSLEWKQAQQEWKKQLQSGKISTEEFGKRLMNFKVIEEPTIVSKSPKGIAKIVDDLDTTDMQMSDAVQKLKKMGVSDKVKVAIADYERAIELDRIQYGQRSGLPEQAEDKLRSILENEASRNK